LPLELSLLSTDRSDVPDRYEISGAPIGLWQVDAGGADLSAAEVTIAYNSVLADLLGASPDSVRLWTFSDEKSSWQQVSSFSLDTTDHLVSGYATNIDDIAVTVDPAPGQNVDEILAEHLAQVSGAAGSAVNLAEVSGQAQGVPEPVAMPLVLMGGIALLGRRRNRAASSSL
jgi:hypothetical protein